MKESRNHLSGAKLLKLCFYLNERRHVLVSDDPQTVAEQAQRALDFPVTKNNVIKAARDAGLGLFEPKPRVKKTSLHDRIAALEDRVAEIEGQFDD